MRAALLIVLSLSAVAIAGPAFNKDNQIDSQESYLKQQQQQQQQQSIYNKDTSNSQAKGPIVDVLKQWCESSLMSQQELTASFKKLVSVIISSPADQSTEQAVMNERICSYNAASGKQGQTSTSSDAQAHELVKDVYMDALIACKSHECTKQLLKLIEKQSDKVDTIRASYYMTRLAVTEKDQIKDTEEIKQLVESFTQQRAESSESVERQKLFAVTSMVGKYCQDKPDDSQAQQLAQEVAKTIVERYVKPVSQQDVQQYQQESINEQQQVSEQLAKKIAKRNAALKALANLPARITKEISECEQQIMSIAQNKQELVTSRQSAIECLEQNDKAQQMLKQLTFDQEEPIEVRIAAYRALMTVVYSADSKKVDDSQKQQIASQIIDEVVKHCENSRNQQQDDQFVLYAISHLDNMRTSEQPEHQAIKECIAKNKQHYMQIQVLCNKFKQQLSDVRRSSRNYKLEQEFNQIESGLVLEGDLIYESKTSQYSNNKGAQMLPKLIRVNMSMPVMGKTVNVVEITVRQNQMDEELLTALKIVQNTKFSAQSVSKVVDQFKSTVEKQQQQQQGDKQQATECDLSIKVDGCTVFYLTCDDFLSSTSSSQHKRNTRSVYSGNSIVEELVDYLKRSPVSFNRGINFNIDERIAKVLDVEANVIAGLRFESRAQGHASDNFEIVAKIEPRFNFEAIVGPAKVSSKKLLQRVSTKTAMNLRLRFKRDELVDVQIDLPMQSMELFTVESQIVERNSVNSQSYNYLPESIYGQEDIYSVGPYASYNTGKLVKRSILDTIQGGKQESMLGKLIKGKRVQRSLETPEKFARATGLRGKLRVVAAPKEMSFVASCQVDKYEPSMQGFHMTIQKSPSSATNQKSYVVSMSTPGSRINRQVQMTLYTQNSQQRTSIKSEVLVSDKLAFSLATELVHDGRQYAVRSELVSRSHKQWRHSIDAGIMISGNSKSPSGRIAQFAYKPYIQLESSSLKRPIQLQGTVAYSQSPKSVISYELKCPTTGDYVQGKLIVDQRDVTGAYKMRKQIGTTNSYRLRRSMQSPLEIVLSKDLTLTNELVAQVSAQAVKVHQMIDWNAQKIALQADFSGTYKNVRDSSSTETVSAQFMLDTVQQVVTIERKSQADERNQYRAQIKSEWFAPSSHQMLAEVRYNGRRESLIAYKHKIDISKVASKQYECHMQVEYVDTERQIAENFSARSMVSNERNLKSIQLDLSNPIRKQSAKVQFDFESLAQHQLSAFVQTQSFAQKCELRNNQRQFAVLSRTDKHGQTVAKLVVELNKMSPAKECKIVVEVPVKRVSIAADLKLASGKRSSLAIQTPRFVSSGEYSFETISRPLFALANKSINLRARHSLKDLESKQAYWMDSALNAADWDKETSYFRFESPAYRTDLEFDPRQQTTKFGAFARSKRSINDDSYDSSAMYSNKYSSLNDFIVSHQSPLGDLANKLNLGQNKQWMMRAFMWSPFAREQLKQQAIRALYQYADRASSHKHAFEYSPNEQRFGFDLESSPNSDFSSASTFEPLRLRGDLTSSYERPSSMSFDSDFMSAEFETKPFGSEESYAKLSALSRNRRSPFKKHESEWRYNKSQGHKASMTHIDSSDSRHALRAQAERDPKKWAKMQFESDKHGKANWEHKWRKHVEKRNSNDDSDEVYSNKVAFSVESPKSNNYNAKPWMHETQFDWQEPTSRMILQRNRRSIVDTDYSPIDYLKHTSARLSSAYSMGNLNEPLYKLDFDYKPQINQARLDVQMPNNLLHTSSFESTPSERLYKLQSKLYNRRTQDSTYDFSAQTKPYVASLATQDQEPVFVHTEHPMLERPISTSSMLYKLAKQPIKLDYSDKYGRQASFDYDQLPLVATSQQYAGLRQKRAAVYYKDSDNDFEHSSSFDFYPETYMGRVKPSYASSANMVTTDNVVIKTQTKFGPIVVRADTSDADNMQCELESPIVNGKIVAETGANMRKLVKVHLDNKSQRVQISKLLRKYAPESIRELSLVDKFARQFDSNRFEHDSELLISIVDSIFKLKSQSYLNSRPIVVIEGEWNEQQGKAYAKINGEQAHGQFVVDLVRKSAELVMDLNSSVSRHISEPVHHVTRIERTSNNFFKLDSVTSYKSRPILKLQGSIAAIVFEQPTHLFQNNHRLLVASDDSHISTFEAYLYEPTQYHITGMYDCCDKKELRIVSKSLESNKVQETLVKFDERTETIVVDSRLSSANEGQVYNTKAKINLPGLFESYKCYRKLSSPNSCASELIYEDKSGSYAAKYQPGDYVSVMTPRVKQSIKLNY